MCITYYSFDIAAILISSISRECEEKGIWAWDCLENEAVLVVPMVLALLGDNPMQSEFACHIGLGGKFFCRACWVKGRDASDEEHAAPRVRATPENTGVISDNESADGSDGSTGAASDNGSTTSKKGKKRKARALETMADMVNRVKSFINVFVPIYSLVLSSC